MAEYTSILTKQAELSGQVIPRSIKHLLEIFSLRFSLIFEAVT